MEAWVNPFKNRCPLRHFTRGIALVAFLIDVFSIIYFHLYWVGKNGSYLIWKMAFLLRGENFLELEASYQKELMTMVDMSVDTFLVAILIVNIFFYIYLQFYKRWAWQYVVGYLSSAAILTFFSALEGFPLGPLWGMANLISIIFYGLLAWAIRNRKTEFKAQGFHFKKFSTQTME